MITKLFADIICHIYFFRIEFTWLLAALKISKKSKTFEVFFVKASFEFN